MCIGKYGSLQTASAPQANNLLPNIPILTLMRGRRCRTRSASHQGRRRTELQTRRKARCAVLLLCR